MSRRPRGFTLMEMMVTVAIIGILVAITAVGVSGLRPRMQVSTAGAEVASILPAAQQHAMATGTLVWVGWIPQNGTSPAKVVVLEDRDADFDPSDLPDDAGVLDVAQLKEDASTDGDEVLRVIELPLRVEQIPASEFGAVDEIPGPYRVWTNFTTDAASGCSFCNNAGLDGWVAGCSTELGSGWIRMLASGEARVHCLPEARGGYLILGAPGGETQTRHLVSFTTPFVLSGSFVNE